MNNNNNNNKEEIILSKRLTTELEYLKIAILAMDSKAENEALRKCFDIGIHDDGLTGTFVRDKFCSLLVDDDHDHHNNNNNDKDDDVKVIRKTVIVHDRNNTPQTILINSNLQTGTCFVSSHQVVDVPNLVTQLLNQCTSVTITP